MAFVNLGTNIYNYLALPETIFIRILVAIIGFLMIYLGLGIYIATDIGVEPFTGLVMLIKDKLKGICKCKNSFRLNIGYNRCSTWWKVRNYDSYHSIFSRTYNTIFSKKVTGILNRQMPQLKIILQILYMNSVMKTNNIGLKPKALN